MEIPALNNFIEISFQIGDVPIHTPIQLVIMCLDSILNFFSWGSVMMQKK
jgi:hypothetical protein